MKKTDIIALVCAAVLVLGFLFSALGPHTITLTKSGFSPRTLTIRPGETVTFISVQGDSFWPASDFHPTHALFPAFDPKKPIAANDSWSFRFDTPGTYPFHDHLAPQFTGTIVVLGSTAEAKKACLAAKAKDALSPECWAMELRDILSKKGLVAAFSYVDDMYATDPWFRNNCHDVMHILGAEAYKKFKTDSSIIDLPQTSYCGYGFYHGFIERMLTESGPNQYDDVRNYCEQVNQKDGESASGPCFHGIGHAIFDSLESSLWGDSKNMVRTALSRCEAAVTTEFALRQCGSGVFNSFANAMSAKNYGISFVPFDTETFCMSQSERYREGCFGETGIGHISDLQMDKADALKFIDSLNPQFRQYMYFIYFSDLTKRAIKNFPARTQSFRDSCVSLSDESAVRGCVRGVLQGIREESQVGKSHEYAFPFCGLFMTNRTLMNFCYDDVIEHALTSEKETPEFKAACLSYTGRTELQCR